MSPTAIVLHGPTSAGKSSIARALQASAPTPAFNIAMDAFAEMSNYGDMRTDAEREQALKLRCKNLQSTLRNVAASHFDIILDLVLRDDEEFAACMSALAPRPVFVIGICCPLAVLEERERARPDRGEGMAREQFGHPAYNRAYAMKVDTSTVSTEEAAHAIREFVSRSAG